MVLQLFVRGNENKTIEVEDNESIRELKSIVAKRFEISDLAQLNLFYNGEPLVDEKQVNEYNIINQTALDFDIGLLGGKVHGSLARAGKVKGQTPKVSI